MIPAGATQLETPTRKRYWVVALGFALAFITYSDRAAIGQAASSIAADLRLSPVQMGYVFSAFGIAYAAFEIPSGWLGDWIGPRKVLLRIVLWWSFFTAATGWTWNYPSLLVTRFLFGMGESGCFPNLAKCFSTWLPPHERLRAEGFKAASARKMRPSGRKTGHTWPDSPDAESIEVTGVAMPPAERTCIKGPLLPGAKTMAPSRRHAAPS